MTDGVSVIWQMRRVLWDDWRWLGAFTWRRWDMPSIVVGTVSPGSADVVGCPFYSLWPPVFLPLLCGRCRWLISDMASLRRWAPAVGIAVDEATRAHLEHRGRPTV